jgi:hypothetical protein
MGRQSNAASRAMPATVTARLTALSGGPVLRRITRPSARLADCRTRSKRDALSRDRSE